MNKKFLLFFMPLLLSASVKEEIIKFYKSHYPTIIINDIKSNKPFPKKYKKIDFKLANYKLPSSTVIIDGKYYFYKLNAKIKVFKATRVIHLNELVQPNTTSEIIKFRSFYSQPLTVIPNNLIASKIISKNAVINRSNTKIRPLILKGDSVSVIFKDKNIEIYSKGTALNDANLNENVKVKINTKIYNGIANKNGEVIIK
ncbi:flagella basal body P-ring formation protein FlgA [Nautilia profundicola AmH]|uniref:Flagella basal body P-ring formation protein FlgA n=1 Tax=Nautilia profundicola (strain ATCC BAA-1463 / DSM 18972 / AmH) TaxID=598659 RepID=B9L9C4_NAUPA|nr:flagellar basal body P-ring formation chaperone FlgA [Nautilia profundicola]ACM93616.1 flagella basal body P-ring formation protein FlgA [Nautilia profundicola AmH]